MVGEAGDGDEAISLAARLRPDVILMDLNMPGTGGIEASRRILYTSPHISIFVVSMHEDDDLVFATLQDGARGYLLKGALKARSCAPFGPSPVEKRCSARPSQNA